ncbi:Holliday junction resolvase RuvX [Candidatus Kaiserbacteria bacterium]|nr:Holliday junction resolvase RuvX [Candidatus Kaiserbacteria bacterium]USN92599.1 MAG: Holliday junction resolvase RuvX [Candidatus Nomurabacteria bacterium]
MKRMGIDYGAKKIGLAITDDSGVMAFPYKVVPNNADFLRYIESLVKERGIKEIVIGHSIDNKGESNSIHKAVESLITDLTLSLGIPIHLEPEQYSTQQAVKIQGKNAHTDASAASIILDSFITKNKKS